MRCFLRWAVPRTRCSLRRRRAEPLRVVAAAVSASQPCANGQRFIHGPPRLSSAWLHAARRLPGLSAFLPASWAVAASLTVQCRGVSSTTSTSAEATTVVASAAAAVAALSTGAKLRHRRGVHRKRGRFSATPATLPLDMPLEGGPNGSFSVVVDPAVSTSVLANSSHTSVEPRRRRAAKSRGTVTRDVPRGALDDTVTERETPSLTADAHLNGFGASAHEPSKDPPPASETGAAEAELAPSDKAVVASEKSSPCRKRKSGTGKRSTRGRRAAVMAVADMTLEPSAVEVGASATASSPAAATLLAEVPTEAITVPAAVTREKPSRGLRRGRSRRRGTSIATTASARGTEKDEVETSGVTVTASATVDPKGASSGTADAGDGAGDAPGADPVRAAALPPAPKYMDRIDHAVMSDADAVEGRVSSSSSGRQCTARQVTQKCIEVPVGTKSSVVVPDEKKAAGAADVDKGQEDISEDGGARLSGRRRRSSSRTRSGKRLRAKPPTDGTTTVVTDAIAASTANAAAEGAVGSAQEEATADTTASTVPIVEVGLPESKMKADSEAPEEVIRSTAAPRAARIKGRSGSRRMKKGLLAPAAVAETPAVGGAAPLPPTAPLAAAAGDEKADATPQSVDSLKKLFDNVDAAKGITSLALKKRLAAQMIRRRWRLQRALQLPPQPLLSTATLTVDEVDAIATPAASNVDDVAGAAVAPKSPTPSLQSPRRRLKQGKKSSPLEASAQSPIAAASLQEGLVQSNEAAVAHGSKSTSRTTKKGGRRGGSVAKKMSVHTAVMTGGASAAAVVGACKVAEVEDPASDAEREADVAAAMAAVIELVSKPEVIHDEFSLAHQADDDTAVGECDATIESSALAACRATQQQQQQHLDVLQSACVSKVASGASGGSGASGSGNRSGSSGGGKGTKSEKSKDTLFFPDYRERVVQIFEQLTQINSALGERFKSQSYARMVERFKRGDKVFQLLPPNLLPLPEDDPQKKAMIEALYKGDPALQKKRLEEVERNRAKRSLVLSPDNLIPGLGTKLREKVIEVLVTGGLEELHRQEAKPIIRAIRELTQVHGVGPRTAIDYFKKYNISTVSQLRDYAIKAGELDMTNKDSGKPSNLVVCADKSKFHLNDAQRLGLVYYEDMCHRIPHEEGRLHEAFMKLRMRKYLGKDYELVVCGSYRRQVESAGDIDVLITHKRSAVEGGGGSSNGGRSLLPPSEVLGAFLAGLKADKYIEATLAQGPTKFMGLCRLRAIENGPGAVDAGKGKAARANSKTPTKFRARRLDVRYVDSDAFPAALLYFTGSKNFNVLMRSEAIKKNCVLNEYGLFRKPTRKQIQHCSVVQKNPDMSFHDMITRLARFDLSVVKHEKKELASGSSAEAGGVASTAPAGGSGVGGDADGASSKKVTAATKKMTKKGREKTGQELAELREMAKIVERQRVQACTERDIFEALSMDYVPPKDRSL